MRRYAALLLLSATLAGCARQAEEKKILARINNYEITQEEFEESFKESVFGLTDTLESRQQFLDTLINQKLILQDAQKKGYDTEKRFLKTIERFWEQSLLKIALEKKAGEISSRAQASDEEVRRAYDALVAEGKADKPYEEMLPQLKLELTKAKEAEGLDDWIAGLRSSAKIEIRYDLLNKEK